MTLLCNDWCTCRSMALVAGLAPVPALVAYPPLGGAGSLKWVGHMQDHLVLHPSLDTALLCSRGHILIHFGPELRPELPMSALMNCLKSETTQLTAIRAHNTIARCLTKLQWKSTHPVFCVTSRLCLVLSVCCTPHVVWACRVLVTPTLLHLLQLDMLSGLPIVWTFH